MKQYARTFRRHYTTDPCVDDQLNSFLENHSNYSVEMISFCKPDTSTAEEILFVVFKVDTSGIYDTDCYGSSLRF